MDLGERGEGSRAGGMMDKIGKEEFSMFFCVPCYIMLSLHNSVKPRERF